MSGIALRRGAGEPGSHKTNDGAQHRSDPEPRYDFALGPAKKLKVMMQRGAEQYPPTAKFECRHLCDDA